MRAVWRLPRREAHLGPTGAVALCSAFESLRVAAVQRLKWARKRLRHRQRAWKQPLLPPRWLQTIVRKTAVSVESPAALLERKL